MAPRAGGETFGFLGPPETRIPVAVAWRAQANPKRDHYFREAPASFGLGAATVLWSMFREYMLEGQLLGPIDLGFHILIFVMATTAAVSRRPRLHEAFAGLMIFLFLTYIALLFARLDI